MPSLSINAPSNTCSNLECDSPTTSLHRVLDAPVIQRRRGFDAFPDEIFYEIFLEVVMDDFNNAATRFNGLKRCAPWNVAAVCGNWRRVCLGNARLWTYVVVSWHTCVSNGLRGYDGVSIVRTSLQLERSKPYPLHVNMAFDCSCRSAYSVLRALGKECHRWKSIKYDNNQEEDHLRNLFPTPARFPQLETLAWRRDYMEDEEFTCSFTELTNLRSVRLSFLDLEGSSLPWNQLTHLNFDSFTGLFDTLLDTVSQCTALTHLQVSVELDFFSENDDYYLVQQYETDSVILQNLSTLDFTDGHFAPTLLLPCLRLPNLRKLIYNATLTPSATVIDFIDRSSCSLTELSLHLEKEELGLSEFLSHEKLAQLESLSIRDVQGYQEESLHCDEALQSLIVDGTQGVLLRRLKHLALHNIAFDTVLLAHMVDSRQEDLEYEDISPLKSIVASICAPMKPGISFYRGVLQELMRKRMQDGLEVYLHDIRNLDRRFP